MSRLMAAEKVMSRKQIRSIVECEARINLWSGAVRSGKTVASLLAFLIAITRAPRNAHIFIIAKTLQTAERNIIDVLQQATGPFGPISRYVHHTRGDTIAVILGRQVHLVGGNNVTAEDRIRGSTASLIYIDEATLIPESLFVMALSRLSVPGARLFATTNPDSPMHWLRRGYMLRTDINMRQWHFTLDDNPSLEPQFVADLKAEFVGLYYRRFILGEWCLAEGAIYENWDHDLHVVKDLPHIVDWLGVGIDYGTVNPFAAELLGLGVDGRLYLTSEYYHDPKVKWKKLVDVEFSQNVRDWLRNVPIPHSGGLVGVKPDWIVVDPSAASFRAQLLRDGVDSVVADNAVLPGLRLMASLIATDRFRVHESCTGFTTEAPGYSWDPKAAEKGEDAPIKVADHALDAGRYVVRTTEGWWRGKLRDPVLVNQ